MSFIWALSDIHGRNGRASKYPLYQEEPNHIQLSLEATDEALPIFVEDVGFLEGTPLATVVTVELEMNIPTHRAGKIGPPHRFVPSQVRHFSNR